MDCVVRKVRAPVYESKIALLSLPNPDIMRLVRLVRMRLMKKNSTPKGKRRAISTSSTPSTRWQLQTAKARFSELFRRTRAEGPQWITKQGKEAVVMLPAEDFETLTARAKQPKSFVQFMRESPLMGSGIDLERQEDYGREVDL